MYAEEAAPHLTGTFQDSWIAHLDAEFPNLRATADYFVGEGLGVQAVRLFGVLRRYWWWSALGGEWLARLVARALDLAGDEAPPGLRSASLICQVYITRGVDFVESSRVAHKAVEEARDAGDRVLEAEALSLEGYMSHFRGADAGGLGPCVEAVALARQSGDPALLAQTLMCLASVSFDLPGCEEIFLEALSEGDRAGDRTVAHVLHGNYGIFLFIEGRVPEARQQWDRALELNPSPERRRVILSNLAYLLLEEGDRAAAESNFIDALSEARLVGGTHEAAHNTLGLGICASLSGTLEQAAVLHGGASMLLEACGAEWEFPEKKYRDRDIAALQKALGSDFERLYDEGRAMPYEEIVDLALGQLRR
jgi:tetratricopeptide (TPR) repeat protein